MKLRFKLLIAGLAASLLLAGPLHAIGDDEDSGARYEYGRLDGADARSRAVVISDGAFTLAADAVVRSASGATLPVGALKRGMRVAFVVQDHRGPGARIITEIVIRSDK